MGLGLEWLPTDSDNNSKPAWRPRSVLYAMYPETEFEARECMAIWEAKAKHSEKVAVHFVRAHSRHAARARGRLALYLWRETAKWERQVKAAVDRKLFWRTRRRNNLRKVLCAWHDAARHIKWFLATQLVIYTNALKSCQREALYFWRSNARSLVAHRGLLRRRLRRVAAASSEAWHDESSRRSRLRLLLPRAQLRTKQQVFERLYTRSVFGGSRRRRAAEAAWMARRRTRRRLCFCYWRSYTALLAPAHALARSEARRRAGWISLRVASDCFDCWRWLQAARAIGHRVRVQALTALQRRAAARASAEAGRSMLRRWTRLARRDAGLRRRFAQACALSVRGAVRRALRSWGERAGV